MSVSIKAEDRLGAFVFTFSYSGIMLGDEKIADQKKEEERSISRKLSVMNVFAYFPGVNLVVGIARIIFSLIALVFDDSAPQHQQSQIKALREAQVVRGVLECCMVFGPLMLIADVAFSIIISLLSRETN